MILKDIVSIYIDDYTPLSDNLKPPSFKLTDVIKWLADRRVRVNLLKCKVTVEDMELASNRVSINFDSPYREEYIEYIINSIIPGLVDHLSTTKYKSEYNDTISKTLEYLVSAAKDEFTIPSSSVGLIINDVFPHLKMIKVPAEGNCYFCSIGVSTGLTDEEIRKIVSSQISVSPNLPYIAKAYAKGCKYGKYKKEYETNPDQFTQNYPKYLASPCLPGDSDCKDCIWGISDYDQYIADYFDDPLISISIDREGDSYEEGLKDIIHEFGYEDENNIVQTIRKYTGSKIYYKENQVYTIGLSYVFPKGIIDLFNGDMEPAFLIEYKNVISYIYRSSHFNGVKIV